MLDLKKLRATPNRPRSFDESYESVVGTNFSLQGKVRVRGEAVHRQQKIFVALHIEATVVQSCSRCLNAVISSLSLDEPLEFRPASTAEDPLTSEAYIYSTEEAMLDLQPYVMGLIANSLTVKPLCRPDCKGLCAQCGQDLNLGPCACSREPQGDPRLKVLKELLP